MALPLLNELQERLHACAIAGLNVIGEDFRLAGARAARAGTGFLACASAHLSDCRAAGRSRLR